MPETTEATKRLCKGCGELEIDPATYSGADGWCGEICRVLAEQFQFRREDRVALREHLHSIEFVSRLGGLK